MRFVGFDVETKSRDPSHPEYALQPQRAPEQSRLTYAALARPNGESLGIALPDNAWAATGALDELLAHIEPGDTVVTWNGVFDLAWALVYGVGNRLARLRWMDAKLLWKWYDPNRYSYHLYDAAEEILLKQLNLPWVPRYLAVKADEKAAMKEGRDTAQTAEYNKLDAYATALLAEYFWARLTPKQRNSAFIEASLLRPFAESWLNGVPLDLEHAERLTEEMRATKRRIEQELGLSEEVLSSPQQLGRVLYEDWKLPVVWETPKGGASTDKTALTYLTDHDPRAALILDWREANTRESKFCAGVFACTEYNGRAVSYSMPSIYSTYTGRVTYSSKVENKDKFRVGIALHQMPRDKRFRQLVVPPPDHDLAEFDFAGQEMRLMADVGEERVLRELFRRGEDPHSYTGAGILGIAYEEFMRRKAAGDEAIAGPKGARYLGKFTNLSLQYRTSAKTLRRKARVDYGVSADYLTAKKWWETYHNLYPGVRAYWKRAIHLARVRGYTETMAGRRYYLPEREFWTNEWDAESTAINFPIQGTGADQKELGLAVVTRKFPELRFAFDLHDGLYFWVARDLQNKMELLYEVKRELSNLPYHAAWGWAPAVPYPVDAKFGPRWGQMEELE